MLNRKYLHTDVPLPKDLSFENIYQALTKTQELFSYIKEKTGIALCKIIQANNFSGMVSNVFTKMLDECSLYKGFSDQHYPDLKNMETGIGLEVKASNKPMKGGEGHNGHSGWHIIVCFEMLKNGEIDFSQVEVANLIGFENVGSDWKYQGSSRNKNNSQRTETYTTTNIGTAKLRDGTIYLNPEYVAISKAMQRNREKLDLPIPSYSIFAK